MCREMVWAGQCTDSDTLSKATPSLYHLILGPSSVPRVPFIIKLAFNDSIGSQSWLSPSVSRGLQSIDRPGSGDQTLSGLCVLACYRHLAAALGLELRRSAQVETCRHVGRSAHWHRWRGGGETGQWRKSIISIQYSTDISKHNHVNIL